MKEKEPLKTESGQSRRNFIKTGALGVAGFTIVPRHVLGRGFLAPSDTLYIAAVGAGGQANTDVGAFDRSGKAKIAFLCDVDFQRAADNIKKFPSAKKYVDWRELFDKESKNFDAVSVTTPDHTHAVVGSAAMSLGKHIWIQKPLAHDVFEVRHLTEMAKKYKVVSQMGNQGSSNDSVRSMREWYDAGLIGDVHTVYCWTNRPVWPQGIAWPTKSTTPPASLNWDLWQGTAPAKPFPIGFEEGGIKLVPFNWRGWWDYGTGALGDMGAHIIEAPMRVLDLGYVSAVEASIGSTYVDEFKEGIFPDSCPRASYAIMTFPKTPKTQGPVKLHWMDGGIMPERPEELGPNEAFGNSDGGMLFVGTKGKILANCYGTAARLLPTSRMNEIDVPEKLARVKDSMQGHWAQWVEASIAGYGKMETSSPFEKAGLLSEALAMANLAIRGYNLPKQVQGPANADGTPGRVRTTYPGRTKILWDAKNMQVTNVPELNQFVKREYRAPWSLSS